MTTIYDIRTPGDSQTTQDHKHDCSSCVFLGNLIADEIWLDRGEFPERHTDCVVYDVLFHDKDTEEFGDCDSSLILRYGDEPESNESFSVLMASMVAEKSPKWAYALRLLQIYRRG